MASQAQERANQALAGFTGALQDITKELHNAQNQVQYWKLEADAWKCRYEQERCRNDRLRRILRCTPQKGSTTLTAQPSLLRGPSPISPRATSDSSLAAAAAAQFARSSSLQQRQQQQHGSVPLPTLAEQKEDLRFSSLPAAAEPQICADADKPCSDGNEGLAPAGVEGLQDDHVDRGLRYSCSSSRVLAATAAAADRHSKDRVRGSWSHDGSIRTSQAAAGSNDLAAAAVGDGAPLHIQRKAGSVGAQQLPDPFASYSSRDLDSLTAADDICSTDRAGCCAADDEYCLAQQKPSKLQQQQQQQELGDQLDSDEALSATMSALISPAAAATAAGMVAGSSKSATAAAGGDRSAAPPPVRRASTLPRNWEQYSTAGGSTCAGAANLAFRSGGSIVPMSGYPFHPVGSSSSGSGSSRHTIDQLLRMMMAFTIMQGSGQGAAADAGVDNPEDEPLQSVSLDDDDGSSGVGLAAAAAVSAAMARAWASAASKEQRAVAAAAGSGGNGSGDGGVSQRAGFRLVATVTNKMGKRAPSSAALSSVYSQDSLEGAGSSSSTSDLTNLGPQQQQQQPGPSPLSRTSGASDPDNSSSGAAAAAKPPVPPSSPQQQGGVKQQPAAATAAANNSTSNASPSSGQATAISLHWLSRPRSVLVMRKMAPSTEPVFAKTLEWLRRHNITIYVEPKVFQALVDSGRVLQHNGSSSSGNGNGNGSYYKSGSGSSISGLLCENGANQGTISGTLLAEDSSAAGAAAGSSDGGSSSGNRALVSTPSWPSHGRYGSSSGVGGSSSSGLIKTWQPELQINQEQQQQQDGDGSSDAKESDLIPDPVAQQLDLVVVLGGDGTVLWTCHIFGNRSVPPLVPFNLGSLGFLTPFDPAKVENVLLRTLRGGFPITLRHRLHATIVRRASTPCAPHSSSKFAAHTAGSSSGSDLMPAVSRNCTGNVVYGEEHVALNEVVIERGISPFLTNLECFCDGGFVTHVQGDGLIIGTPTGSTAYSLAAGGSMVHPQVPCILFTPICPHSLSFRPLMFPDYCQLCIQVPVDSRGHVWASFDGKDRTELVPGDAVVVRLSRWPVPSVAAEADPSSDWFSAVRECLHWNLRKVQGGAGN